MTAITFSWMDCHIDWCLIYSALALQVWLGLSAAVDFECGPGTFTYSDVHSLLRYVLMEFCIQLLHSEDAKWTIYQSQAMQASVLHHRLCWILLWRLLVYIPREHCGAHTTHYEEISTQRLKLRSLVKAMMHLVHDTQWARFVKGLTVGVHRCQMLHWDLGTHLSIKGYEEVHQQESDQKGSTDQNAQGYQAYILEYMHIWLSLSLRMPLAIPHWYEWELA